MRPLSAEVYRYRHSNNVARWGRVDLPLAIVHLQNGPRMTVYVAEIKDRSVAAFRAENHFDAERFVRDRVFRDDLMALTTGDLPLWDGVSQIQVRSARPNEEAKWRASHANAIRHGNIEGDDDAWIVFLVSLNDPARHHR